MCKEDDDSDEVKTYKCAVTSEKLHLHKKSRASRGESQRTEEVIKDTSGTLQKITSINKIIAMEEEAGTSRRAKCERLTHAAEFHIAINKMKEAKDLLDHALMIADEWLVEEDWQRLTILYNLTRVEHLIGSERRAKELGERLLFLQQTMLGESHIEVADTLEHLAMINQGQRNFGWSQMQYQKALTMKEYLLGPEHNQIAMLLRKLASLHFDMQDYARCKMLLGKALDMRKALGSAQDEELGSIFQQLANVFYSECNYARAENHYKKALRLRKKLFGNQSLAVAETLGGLGKVFCATKKFDKSERSFNHALRNQVAVFGEHHKEVGATLARLSGVHRAQGRFEKANQLCNQAMVCKTLSRESEANG